MRRSIFALALACLASLAITGCAVTPAPAASPPGDFTRLSAEAQTFGTTRAIVELNAPIGDAAATNADTTNVRRELGATGDVVRAFGDTNLAAVAVDARGVEVLRRSRHVKRVVADELIRPALSQTVKITGATKVWGTGANGAGQTVAVIDTGVDTKHPFLKGAVSAEACFSSGFDGSGGCPNGTTSQVGAGAAAPCKGSSCEHGTHVAGIVAGRRNVANAPTGGMAPGAKVLAIQVFSVFPAAPAWNGCWTPCAMAYTSDIISALTYVRTVTGLGPIAAVNMSLGGGGSTTACANSSYESPIAALRAAGVAVVVASGNDGKSDRIAYPACSPNAISVGATNSSDEVETWFSNSAPFLTLLAPGSGVRSSVPDGGYQWMSGTSMAAPHVAGAFALLRQRYGATATVTQLVDRLKKTGKPVVDPRNKRTFMRIDVGAALPAGKLPPLSKAAGR